MSTIVKVCGVRTAEVADAAVEAGADWVGIVFAEGSPRRCDAEAARRVVDAVAGRADLVGVFVEPSAEECDEVADRFGLAAVQAHGRVDRSLAAGCAVPVIPAFNLTSQTAALTLDWWPDGLVLLDAAPMEGELPGGTGRLASALWAAEVARHRPIMLAGGLTPGNVARAVAAVRPLGVDASTGLESAPGVKEPSLVREFVRRAREVLGATKAGAPAAAPANGTMEAGSPVPVRPGPRRAGPARG